MIRFARSRACLIALVWDYIDEKRSPRLDHWMWRYLRLMIGYEFLENPLTMLTGLYHVIGDVLVPSLQNGVFWSWLSWFRPSSVLVSWVELGRQVISNKSSSTLLRLLLLYFVYFVLVVLVKIEILEIKKRFSL